MGSLRRERERFGHCLRADARKGGSVAEVTGTREAGGHADIFYTTTDGRQWLAVLYEITREEP